LFTNLSTGDQIRIGDSVSLTVLAIEGDLVFFGVELSEPGGNGLNALVPRNAKADLDWWDLN
jgi:hypothetical protein